MNEPWWPLTLYIGLVSSLLPNFELSGLFSFVTGIACPDPVLPLSVGACSSWGTSPEQWVQSGTPKAWCGIWCGGLLTMRRASALNGWMWFQDRTSPSPVDAPLAAGTSPLAQSPSRNPGKYCVDPLTPLPDSLFEAAPLNFKLLGFGFFFFFRLCAPGGMQGENTFLITPVSVEVRGSWDAESGESAGEQVRREGRCICV